MGCTFFADISELGGTMMEIANEGVYYDKQPKQIDFGKKIFNQLHDRSSLLMSYFIA